MQSNVPTEHPEKEMDPDSQASLTGMGELERIRSARIPSVRTVLVVISAAGMVFDVESLRQKILLNYPEAAVFFLTTLGKSVGSPPPKKVDLLIDFTGPAQRQSLFYAKKLKAMARVSVGRNAGLFRKKIYDRIFDEKQNSASLSRDKMDRERQVQREVLRLVGIAFLKTGDTPPDRGKSIALELPPMLKL